MVGKILVEGGEGGEDGGRVAIRDVVYALVALR